MTGLTGPSRAYETAGLRFLSLFAGIGGFDLGFERAGMQCAGQVEIDVACTRVLARHFPDVPRHGDVRTALPWWLNTDALFAVDGHGAETSGYGAVDVIAGGFPCQDVSLAKQQPRGLAGERSRLLFDALTIAGELQPRAVIIENVPGLLTSNGGDDFQAVIEALAESGFPVIEWRTLDSRFFGVPQQRRRVFIVGRPDDRPRPTILSEPGSSDEHPRPCGTTGTTITRTPPRGPRNHALVADTGAVTSLTRSFGAGGPDLAHAQAGWLIPCEHGARRLTPTECERIQGFPDGWTAGESDPIRYQMLGNAVTVPVAEWIGHRLTEAIT